MIDIFLAWWLKSGRYLWSRCRRAIFERGYLGRPLPTAVSLDEIASLLRQITWTMDGPLHLYDAISRPQAVWDRKRDDCDGFAVLAAHLLNALNPATSPVLLTVLLRPVRKSHTVCVFSEEDALRFFNNNVLDPGSYTSYQEIADKLSAGSKRRVCWDIVEASGLRQLEFHRG